MRTIKFRAWDNGKKQWLLGYEYPNLGGFSMDGECVLMGEWANVCTSFMFENDNRKRADLKLMQFTGLKDKNEKEIYEGDIVIYNRGVGNWTGQRMSTTHEIVFTDEVFAFVMKYGSSYIKLRKHWNYIYEVIGNIHENPELLTVPTAVL
ncbi:YopX family protein [Lutibacter sp.]|uniref:YopX family protein n=1 Tax=Lutibacter sp. TaxID=1925666 RepID=UPI0027342770|nr:YopX family protein [Lutibacter sp.]MDP3312306.1 YopX family protein [Lutibacter sp.]